MACTNIEIICRRELARRLFLASKEKLKSSAVDTIGVYYKDDLFLKFVAQALAVLRERDSLDFLRVQKSIRGIVESPVNEFWAGRAIGVYFDNEEERGRFSRTPERYAARLVRFATEARILASHKIIVILRNNLTPYCLLLLQRLG
jgi:hypothetical protein